MGALSHIKVLDLSRILAGPWASQVLGDLGATVVKIERPDGGDDTRTWGPPYLGTESAYFLSTNRNKKSVTVDFTKPEGQEVIRKLAASADVLLENFKVGGLAKFGLDYASLKALNPRLIYCSITGFGQTGPYAARAGYDALLQAMGGYMGITGSEDGKPQKVGVAVVDLLTGLYSTVGILAALQSRERTGVGQHIDMALLDVEVACLANQGMNYLVTGSSPKPLGNAHPSIVPYQDFPTLDGAMMIAVGNDTQFKRLCDALGLAELAGEAEFATNSARVINRVNLVSRLSAATVMKTTSHWVRLLEEVGVPCGPINSLEEVFADPHVMARELRMNLDRPNTATGVPSIRSPLRLSATPVEYRRAPPLLGQHTREVLVEELGLAEEEIAALVAKGIVFCGAPDR